MKTILIWLFCRWTTPPCCPTCQTCPSHSPTLKEGKLALVFLAGQSLKLQPYRMCFFCMLALNIWFLTPLLLEPPLSLKRNWLPAIFPQPFPHPGCSTGRFLSLTYTLFLKILFQRKPWLIPWAATAPDNQLEGYYQPKACSKKRHPRSAWASNHQLEGHIQRTHWWLTFRKHHPRNTSSPKPYSGTIFFKQAWSQGHPWGPRTILQLQVGSVWLALAVIHFWASEFPIIYLP